MDRAVERYFYRLSQENLRLYNAEKRVGHYAKRTVDIQYRSSRSVMSRNDNGTMMGSANRTHFDLRTHSKS